MAESSEKEVRKLIDDFVAAVRTKDLDRVMSFYSDDVVAYDIMPPLRHRGTATYRKAWKMGFDMTDGPFTVDRKEITVVADGDVAFAYAIDHMNMKTTQGERMNTWSRWTGGFRKVGGTWKIVHENASVPIDMETQKAIWDAKL